MEEVMNGMAHFNIHIVIPSYERDMTKERRFSE